MTAQPPGEEDRVLVPRWRSLGRSVGELRSAKNWQPKTPTFRSLHEASLAFVEDPGWFTAGDLLAQARLSGQSSEEVVQAQDFVEQYALKTGTPVPIAFRQHSVQANAADLEDNLEA